jgi:hypothetical protein
MKPSLRRIVREAAGEADRDLVVAVVGDVDAMTVAVVAAVVVAGPGIDASHAGRFVRDRPRERGRTAAKIAGTHENITNTGERVCHEADQHSRNVRKNRRANRDSETRRSAGFSVSRISRKPAASTKWTN